MPPLHRPTPPKFPGADKILAIADTLIASESSTIPYTHAPNHYANLQIPNFSHNSPLISEQFNKLIRLINDVNHPFPIANEAQEHLQRAHYALTDPKSKRLLDDLLQDYELPRFWLPFRAKCSVCSVKFVFDNDAYSNGLLKCPHCRRMNVGDDSQPDEPVFDMVFRHGIVEVDCRECVEDWKQVGGYLVFVVADEVVDGLGVVIGTTDNSNVHPILAESLPKEGSRQSKCSNNSCSSSAPSQQQVNYDQVCYDQVNSR